MKRMGAKRTKKDVSKKKRLKHLTDWDWTTLVASWRYYEYRMTIASSMFPGEIVRRFFSGEYDEESCHMITHQFVEVDHHHGEEDWSSDGLFGKGLHDCDRESWCMFWAFCNAWLKGFKTLSLDNGKGVKKQCDAFWCDYTKKWHPKDSYIDNPFVMCYIPKEYIVAR